MYLQRVLDIGSLLQKKSIFLFGPRATGKTTLIKKQLGKKILIINLLDSDLFMLLMKSPWELENIINSEKNVEYVVIDEVQKVPMLLNEVHRLIEERNIRFLLTGSSSRKLKRQENVNLLAGRAWEARLNPLTMHEIPNFSLDRYLQYGGIPSIYLSDYPHEEIKAYVNTYLKDEIQTEAVVRKIQAFTKFINFAALTSGRFLNFSAIASDAGVSASTIREYYQILEDTLMGTMVPAWQKTVKRKAVSSAKFYFFDVGVMHYIAGIKHLERHSDIYGFAFEHFIAMELKSYIDYTRLDITLSYWCSKHGSEVDFILGDEVAIEVKTCQSVSNKHLKGLRMLQQEGICKKYILVSFDRIVRVNDQIELYDWRTFLDKLWGGEFI